MKVRILPVYLFAVLGYQSAFAKSVSFITEIEKMNINRLALDKNTEPIRAANH
ncbi:hypothetical protein [Chania multitudinisentens]|uniref:hypothetical protein n=1 Tax=Chania multitudinisentens TaxID=1639108 RepID=UPI0003E13BB4|nr:hypothetical protein [Chania multitudinisentens]